MVVQHNLRAMNSNRMLGLTQSQQSKSSEKLSSGYKINRAADDAAGLSISEKMRKQIRGLAQASLNAQDGISAVQTAEGALHEVQDMLQRMNELAVKASNGTMSETDRTYIQNEIDQLSVEIDRVSETTKFNEAYLLKGDTTATKGYSYAYKKFSTGSAKAATVLMNKHEATGLAATITINVTNTTTTTVAVQDALNELLVSLRDQGLKITNTSDGKGVTAGGAGKAKSETINVELLGNAATKYDIVQDSTNVTTFTILDKATGVKLITVQADMKTNAKEAANYEATVTAGTIGALQSQAATAAYYDAHGNKISENALANYVVTDTTAAPKVALKAGAPKVYDAVGNETTLAVADIGQVKDKVKDLTFKLHVGADGTSNNKISLAIMNMSARGLGVNDINVEGVDDTNAIAAIDTIKEAIQKISTQRSALGAVQNRLEHTINNLDNVVENTTAAESQIRDTDMAAEMVKFSNSNILAQAGQAMLAQSNQANQGVLALLQ